MKRKIILSVAMLLVLFFTGCAGKSDADSHMEGMPQGESAAVETPDEDSGEIESAQNEPETDGIIWDLTKRRNVPKWLEQSIIFPTM